jgi:tape measure domain-containing protein
MARYTINFSTNANAIARELEKVNKAIADVARNGKKIKIDIDTGSLRTSFDATFRTLDKQIAAIERRLSGLRIGSRRFQETATGLGVAQGMRERGGMQARAIQLGAQAGAFDAGSFVQLRKQIEAASIEASQLAPNTEAWINLQGQIGKLNGQLQSTSRLAESVQLSNQLGAFTPGSLNQLEAKLTILRNRAREISPDTEEWRELNKQIREAERGIAKQTRRPLTRGQRLGAAGGAFLYGGGLGGGVGSAVGGIAGGLMGGPAGAFAGAAIGQAVDNMSGMISSAAKSAATIAQLQRGLALASIDAKDFAESQKAIADSSNTLVVPMEQVYRQFTQLRVNTKQYGLSVQDTQQILEGTVLAVSSVGGSLEDVDGAMRAIVQIFSKGSVQAEELRGQLGERFPGAVIKFAQANKMSFDELQDALKNGEVGIKEFVTFAKENYEDYGKFAERLATGPEFAGRRLEKAMADMQIAVGSALGPAGAVFQDFFTETIQGFTSWVNENKQFVSEYLRDWGVLVTGFARIIGTMVSVAVKVSSAIIKAFSAAFREVRRLLGMMSVAEVKRDLDKVNAKIASGAASGKRRGAATDSLELRRQQLQRQFEAMGGQAALDAQAPAKVDDFTYGGPGAGLDLGATSDGKGGKAKAKKERESQLPQLQLRLELAKKLFEINKQIATARINGNEILVSELELLKQLTELENQGKQVLLENIPMEEKKAKLAELQFQRQEAILSSQLQLQLDLNTQYEETKKKLKDIVASQEEETSYVKQYYDLVLNGVTPAVAKLKVEIAKRFAEEKKSLDAQIEQLKTSIDQQKLTIAELQAKEDLTRTEQERLAHLQAITREMEKQLGLRIEGRDALPGQQAQTEASATEAQGPKPFGVIISEGYEQAEKDLGKLANVANMVVTAANGIGDAFGKAFTDIATGAQTWQEGLGNAFRSVASMFADMVAQILAKWAAVQIIGMFLPGLTGGGGGGAKPPLPGSVALTAANGAVWEGGFTPFANGGVVKGPTLGLVGEGRFNEAVVPLPDGRKIPVDLGGGAGNNISTNIVVNVNNGQASSQINGSGGQSLGRELEGAVRSVILKESRPGGIIYNQR